MSSKYKWTDYGYVYGGDDGKHPYSKRFGFTTPRGVFGLDIPPVLLEANISELQGIEEAKKQVLDYIDNFKTYQRKGVGLYLYSSAVGTGKSTLAANILIEVLKIPRRSGEVWSHPDNAIIGKFLLTADYIQEKTPWEDKEKKHRLERWECSYEEYPLLVLDDLGRWEISTPSMVQTNRQKIQDLIQERYNAMRPTIITSNDTPEQLKSRYGDAIYSRLSACMKFVEVKGIDYRRAVIGPTLCESIHKA